MVGGEAPEGLSTWQQVGGGLAIFLTTAAGIMARFVAKRAEPKDVGETGRHHVIEAASIADTGPLYRLTERGVVASEEIRDMLRGRLKEDAARRVEEEREEERKEIIARLDKAEDDRRELLQEIASLRNQGAKHTPGRPLRSSE